MSPTQETDEIANRPGQAALAYRITDYAGSLRRMLGRLHTYTIPDGPNQGTQPLARLTTRASTDPSIALLDACAAVFDVLSFYQERIADEGYLRTAKEDRSLFELTRAIGYQPAPALAASTYLAFTVDTAPGMPDAVTVAAGTQIKSVPGQDEKPQTFETAVDMVARASCNQLRPLRTRVQSLIASSDEKSGTAITSVRLDGVSSRLREGDLLRVAGGTTLRVMQVSPNTTATPRYTDVTVAVMDGPALRLRAPQDLPSGDARALPATLSASTVTEHILGRTWSDEALVACLRERGWSAAELGRQVQKALALVQAPQVLLTYRQQLGFFGVTALPYASLPKPDTTYYRGADLYAETGSSWDDSDGNNKRTIWVDSWGNRYSEKSPGCDVYLERSVAGILPGSSLLLVCPRGVSEQTVSSAIDASVRGYATLARTTGLKLSAPPASAAAASSDTFLTRDTVAYLQSELLPLSATVPLVDPQPVRDRVMLDTLLLGLPSGQPLLVSGELADAPGSTASEVAFLAQATHSGGYTTLYFRAPLDNDYLLGSVAVSANVVAATHGETVERETLGSGDGGQQNQRFVLKRKPLTYLPAVGESGSVSTLEVRVNGILWREVSSLLSQDAASPCYVIERLEDGSASILFGDGVHGARLPSGKDNVVARYRFGSGTDGMLRSGSLQLLLTRPLGLRGVANPLATVGGAAAETAREMRENAPLSARTLGRAVSLSDYEALAGAFPDIAKAQAVSVLLGGANAVHLTVATQDGSPLLSASSLYQSLLGALRTLGNPLQTLLLDDYVPRKFRLRARLAIDPLRISTDVRDAVAAALRQTFSFANRSFAEPVHSSDVIAVMQGVAGVRGAILDALYLASEPVANSAMLSAAPAFVDHEGASTGAELLLLELLEGDLEVLS